MRRLLAILALTLLGQGNGVAEKPQDTVDGLAEFTGYADRAPPTIAPREEQMTFFPCSQCHAYWKTNENPRLLAPVHDVGLEHGEGRIWCWECHSAEDRDQLQTLRGSQVSFEASWQVCGQCHADRQKDWYYGAHGKRSNGWQADPERHSCTHCHNPHKPPFMTREPKAPPPVRAGLRPMPAGAHPRTTVWERRQAASKEQASHD